MVDITPNTGVRLTLTKAVAIIGSLAIIVATGVSTYTSITTSIKDHTADVHRHLDDDFEKQHGAPIGKWDLDVIHREDKEAMDGMKKSIDELTLTPLHFEDCSCTRSGQVVCRIRH